jgi:hypothetical protein
MKMMDITNRFLSIDVHFIQACGLGAPTRSRLAKLEICLGANYDLMPLPELSHSAFTLR